MLSGLCFWSLLVCSSESSGELESRTAPGQEGLCQLRPWVLQPSLPTQRRSRRFERQGSFALSSPYLTFGSFALADKKGTSWVSKGQELSLGIFSAKFSKVPPLKEEEERK